MLFYAILLYQTTFQKLSKAASKAKYYATMTLNAVAMGEKEETMRQQEETLAEQIATGVKKPTISARPLLEPAAVVDDWLNVNLSLSPSPLFWLVYLQMIASSSSSFFFFFLLFFS